MSVTVVGEDPELLSARAESVDPPACIAGTYNERDCADANPGKLKNMRTVIAMENDDNERNNERTSINLGPVCATEPPNRSAGARLMSPYPNSH